MNHILIYGKEHTFLDSKTGLLYRNSSLVETAPMHTHTFYEIFVVTSGTALHMVNQTMQTLKKGDFVFIRPNDTHSYEFYYSTDFQIINVGFSVLIYESIKNFLSCGNYFQLLESQPLPPVSSLADHDLSEIMKGFTQIGSDMKRLSPVNTVLHAKCVLANAFAEHFLTNKSLNIVHTNAPKWFNEMLLEMQKIENLQIGFPKMVEICSCSSSHLCRIFKQIMNQTPTEYINNKRLDYAVYYLAQTSDEIIQISENCGFHNLSHFYHLFKSKYHITPLKYRQGLHLLLL